MERQSDLGQNVRAFDLRDAQIKTGRIPVKAMINAADPESSIRGEVPVSSFATGSR